MGRIVWHGGSATARKLSPLAEHIGRQLLLLRAEKQISMRDAAKKAGLSVAFFCDMENGKTLAGADTLVKLSRAFGVPVGHWFIGFEEFA